MIPVLIALGVAVLVGFLVYAAKVLSAIWTRDFDADTKDYDFDDR